MKLKIKFHLCGTQSSKHDMQNIVTWGQKTHLLLVIFTCISMGGLFSGVPLITLLGLKRAVSTKYAQNRNKNWLNWVYLKWNLK